ncbi:MAG: PKD domain-containing protein, partial [Bacteroidetes bacterium]|nr:PKD domain-containing protein [Bacteroidota bacterium]
SISTAVMNDQGILQDVQLVNLDSLPPLADFSAVSTFNSCQGTICFINQSSASSSTTWLWDFGDGNSSTEENPVYMYRESGMFSVTLTASNPKGTDTKTKTNFITIDLPDGPAGQSGSICDTSGIFTLTASGSGIIFWYDSASGGSMLHTGDTLVTPLINETTAFFAEEHFAPQSQYVGKEDNSDGGDYYTYNVEQYLVFDCYTSVTLKSVKVYADGDGDRLIKLQDSNGDILDSVTVFIPDGTQRIDLGFTLPAANDLRLTGPPQPDLFRTHLSFGSLDYPYTLTDTLSITGNSGNNTKYYYYFYDWEITGSECRSDRTPVWAILNEEAVSSFSYTVNNMTVQFHNQSEMATEYEWDFGDGNTSALTHPEHNYISDGDYTVTLIALNGCSSDTLSQSIAIAGTAQLTHENRIFIAPVPAGDNLSIKGYLPGTEPLEIRIFDFCGKSVLHRFFSHNSTVNITLPLAYLPDGIYFVYLDAGLFHYKGKIIIMN